MARNSFKRRKSGGPRPTAGRKQSPIGEVRRDFAEKLLNTSHAHDRALKILTGRGNRTVFVDLYKFLCQMAFGKPVQPTHITGENGGPVQIVFAGTLPPWAPKGPSQDPRDPRTITGQVEFFSRGVPKSERRK